ncbi:MAG: permease prefix domain 1-containing protein [Treponema sp.]|jgi:hypothetical protein|nr:permease prefix domain 1-containing protein [Treponema sp.]
MQNTKSYVDSLFSGYEETKDLADFKEELTGYLNDKIADLVKKGLEEDGAFKKAASELGGVSALADEISLKKKQEVIGEAFMDVKHFMKPPRIIAYIVCGLFLSFGAISSAMAFLGNDAVPELAGKNQGFTGLFGVLLGFVPLAIAGFTWLGLTQELPALYPMPKKRAVWYSIGTFVLSFSVILVPLTYFSAGGEERAISAIATLIPFALPAAGLLAFLVLTEKDRLKPWARRRQEAELFIDPVTSARFGLFVGAIWMSAIALGILSGFIIGFKFSWIAFLFAIPAQLCLQGVMMKNRKQERQPL